MEGNNLQINMIDPLRLRANAWNTNVVSPENELKLDESIDRFGMFKPILVRELNDGTLEILGGENRVSRAVKKKLSEVPVINLGKMTDDRAKEIGLVDNGRYGTDDVLALANLLNDIGDSEDLASFLPFSDVEMNSIFAATEIDLSELDMGEEDETPEAPTARPMQTHQIMRFRVPVEDAHTITEQIERTIKEQSLDDSDSLTNAGDALVYLLTRKGSE